MRPHVLFVPQMPERRASSWTTWEWSTKRFTSGPKFLMYQLNTAGSAASNITLSRPSSLTIFATTSVRQLLTFSVIPSDSTMIRWAPASRYRFAARMAWDGSEVPSASSSSTELAPPAPNWMAVSGVPLTPRSVPLLPRLLRHQAEGTAAELEDVDVRAHRLEDVLQVPLPHRRVVRTAHFRDPGLARFLTPFVDGKEIETAIRCPFHVRFLLPRNFSRCCSWVPKMPTLSIEMNSWLLGFLIPGDTVPAVFHREFPRNGAGKGKEVSGAVRSGPARPFSGCSRGSAPGRRSSPRRDRGRKRR